MARSVLILVLLMATLTTAAPADVRRGQARGDQTQADQTKTRNLVAYAELLRSDLRVQKVAIITEVMGFTDAESAAFWPVYRQYDAEMSALGDERAAVIDDYARHYTDLTDARADALALKALDLETRRQAAKARCYDRLKKVLPARTALRFLQVEQQLLLITDLQISAALPIARD